MARRWLVDFFAEWIDWSQRNISGSVRATDPGRIHTRLGPHAPSIAFHAWHMGRWADRYQSALPVWLAGGGTIDPTTEIWFAQNVVGRWGLRDIATGDFGGTGAGLDDEASAALPLPAADELLGYIDAAFSAFTAATRTIEDDSVLERVVTDLYGEQTSIADALADAFSHTDRHLGMIEALRGVLGDRGTVTL